MPKWNGGVIGVANNPTQSSAKGIWSLSEATKAIRAGLWPPSNAGADPYFENVTMLLSGDGTNGAQNNTFLDSSTNAFTITRNGNTTQGTFTPFSKPDGRWSNYFDGTGDNLTSTHPAMNATWTIEAWIYRTSGSANQSIVHLNSGGVSGIVVYLDTSNYIVCTDGVTGQSAFSNLTVPINAWAHIAVVRSGGTTTGYVNGTVAGSHTFTPASVNAANVGAYNGSLYFPGYMSNVRVVNGTAVYTGAFTPSTTPLTAITNTSLLTCQSNRFIDNSTNAFAITRNGDVSVQTFSPFPTLTAYAAGTNGGSGYFDGSGDYLDVASNAALGVGSGDFTLECWIYLTANFDSTGQGIITAAYNTNFALIGVNSGSGNKIDFYVAGTLLSTSTNYINLNAWTHIAAVRSSGTTKIYFDGVEKASSGSLTGTGAAAALYIGTSSHATTQEMTGYISSARLVKGTAVYTAAFTPPTAPLTAITNTSLLLNFTNGGIVDAAMSNDLETVGGAQISTTQSKFGGASMYFDGNGDDLIVPYNPVFGFGTGDFTVEGWFYFSDVNTTARGIVALGDGANGGGPYNAWSLRYLGSEGSNQISFARYDGTVYEYITTGVSLSANTWYHIAVSRSGGTLKIFVNGTSYYSATVTLSFAPINTNPLRVALQYYGPAGGYGGPRYWQGYIDDLRITKGYARYTANFTAPVGAFVGFGD